MRSTMNMNKNPGMKAYVVAIAIQLIFTGSFVLSKAAYDTGLSICVFVFYRQAAGCALLLPPALLQRLRPTKSEPAPSMSHRLMLMLFLRALLELTGLSLYQLCLKHTSATVISVTQNSLPVVTFFLALLFRMEDLKLKSSSGIAKIAGVALSLAGVLVIAFYAGPSLSPVNHHRAFTSHTSGSAANVTRRAWAEWTFLMVLANMTWSLWILMQAPILRECPNKLLVTTVESVFSILQSFIVAAVVERDFSRWMLRFDVSLLAILYSGFVVMGVAFYLQAWCVEMKGPVFLSVWTPLCFVLTMFCSSFFLGENVHVGSIVGAILLVAGLYSMLWGKTKENNSDHSEQDGQHQQEKSSEIEKCNGKEEQEQRMASKDSTSTGVSASPIQHV